MFASTLGLATALVVVTSLIAGEGAGASTPPTMLLDPAKVDIDGDLGEMFSVEVVVEDVTDLGGFEFELLYDDSYFNIDIQEGLFLASTGNGTICNKANLSGHAQFACVTVGALTGVTGSGAVATIELTVKSTAFSTAELTLMGCRTADPNGNLLPLNGCKGGEVNAPPPPVGGVSLEAALPADSGGSSAGVWAGVAAAAGAALGGALMARRRLGLRFGPQRTQ
ncbi:MAG: cohesin domain-containing protein [Dehalococcoidia bacterium]